MKFVGTSTVLFLLLLALSLAATSPSEARKKVPVQNGCTLEQLDQKDSKLRACYAKQDEDVIKGNPYLHEVACVNGHRYCCKHDNASGRFSECEQIDRRWHSGGVANPTEPPADPGPRRTNGPNNPQKPTTASPN